MTNKPLLGETALVLRTLCLSCGLPKTGPKRVLVQRLRRAARQFQPIPPEARILSIDLGLKNFAYALLSPAAPSKRKQAAGGSSIDTPLNSPVHLHAWNRLDLTLRSHTRSTPTTRRQTIARGEGKEVGATTTAAAAEEEEEGYDDVGEEEEEEEAYSPAALSALAAHLVRTRLLPLRPTHVLIERQRFRTGGAAAIFEWTLRVNSLEAMLHAAFAALRGVRVPAQPGEDDDGSGGGGGGGVVVWNGVVCSVLPRAVAGFLFPAGSDALLSVEDGGTVGGKEKKKTVGAGAAYQMLKREKVDMLARHLNDRRLIIPVEGQAEEMVRLFMAGAEKRRKGKRRGGRRRRQEGVEETERKDAEEEEVVVVAKLDDLSDAVLQGMVWLQWQSNLEALTRERPALFDN
ncbi:mitochondrial resolvase Ydc2 [Thermothelomyces heterothallicus CBS 203.75]